MTPQAVVSISGGKDSTATLLVSVERGLEPQAVFADTGNEHPLTYEYVDYLEAKLGLPVVRLRCDLADEWWRRMEYVRDRWPEKGVPEATVTRVLAFMERGPIGNPFLDLCIIKGRFPSRKAQFCTQWLKTQPLNLHLAGVAAEFGWACSWQGVRADESLNRRDLPDVEVVGPGLFLYRPIHKWTVDDVFAQHRRHGVQPNPLYRLGMSRVGCMPCINTNKSELAEIARRFPEHINRIEEWELIVGDASKRGRATFLSKTPEINGVGPISAEEAYERANIRVHVDWARTARGGRQYDLLWMIEEAAPPACSSAYGLCE